MESQQQAVIFTTLFPRYMYCYSLVYVNHVQCVGGQMPPWHGWGVCDFLFIPVVVM